MPLSCTLQDYPSHPPIGQLAQSDFPFRDDRGFQAQRSVWEALTITSETGTETSLTCGSSSDE